MGADDIDLMIYGHAVRLRVQDPESRAALVTEFDGRPSDGSLQTAFVSSVPAGSSKLHVVVDRSGFVLGRTRRAAEAHGILRRHLDVFAPAPIGGFRIQMRALLSDAGTAVLAGFPLFTEPAPVERRLSRAGHRLVDRLVVDVSFDDPSEPSLLPQTDPPAETPPSEGHGAIPEHETPIVAMLVAGDPRTPATTPQYVTMFAEATTDALPRSERIAAAQWLARLPIQVVASDRRAARYEALQGIARLEPT